MKQNKIEQFNILGKEVFQKLCNDFEYNLQEIKISEVNERPWSVKHIYINHALHLKIEIEQAPYYTDYGFSFVIQNLKNDQYNIIYNIPHEKQDEDGKFISLAANDIFSSLKIQNLINGTTWEEIGYIFFKK